MGGAVGRAEGGENTDGTHTHTHTLRRQKVRKDDVRRPDIANLLWEYYEFGGGGGLEEFLAKAAGLEARFGLVITRDFGVFSEVYAVFGRVGN